MPFDPALWPFLLTFIPPEDADLLEEGNPAARPLQSAQRLAQMAESPAPEGLSEVQRIEWARLQATARTFLAFARSAARYAAEPRALLPTPSPHLRAWGDQEGQSASACRQAVRLGWHYLQILAGDQLRQALEVSPDQTELPQTPLSHTLASQALSLACDLIRKSGEDSSRGNSHVLACFQRYLAGEDPGIGEMADLPNGDGLQLVAYLKLLMEFRRMRDEEDGQSKKIPTVLIAKKLFIILLSLRSMRHREQSAEWSAVLAGIKKEYRHWVLEVAHGLHSDRAYPMALDWNNFFKDATILGGFLPRYLWVRFGRTYPPYQNGLSGDTLAEIDSYLPKLQRFQARRLMSAGELADAHDFRARLAGHLTTDRKTPLPLFTAKRAGITAPSAPLLSGAAPHRGKGRGPAQHKPEGLRMFGDTPFRVLRWNHVPTRSFKATFGTLGR
ncbi:MAG: hypothetical protein Q7T11_05585 [Deltaproteobacteria bacterium]|nr:hypothetical protein [Deltaproteobacteria bacterium]